MIGRKALYSLNSHVRASHKSGRVPAPTHADSMFCLQAGEDEMLVESELARFEQKLVEVLFPPAANSELNPLAHSYACLSCSRVH